MAASGPAPAGPSDLVCPWCSASLAPAARDCPSCGAQLIAEQDSDLPGLTSVDARAKWTEPRVRQRSRLLSWISGDSGDDVPTSADVRAVAPPDPAVQQEILRLQIAAELADLQAEVASFAADDMVEMGRRVDLDATEATDQAPDETSGADARDADPGSTEAGGAAETATLDGTVVVDRTDGAAEVEQDPPVTADPAPDVETTRRELEAQIAELQARMAAIDSDTAGPTSEDPTQP